MEKGIDVSDIDENLSPAEFDQLRRRAFGSVAQSGAKLRFQLAVRIELKRQLLDQRAALALGDTEALIPD